MGSELNSQRASYTERRLLEYRQEGPSDDIPKDSRDAAILNAYSPLDISIPAIYCNASFLHNILQKQRRYVLIMNEGIKYMP